MPEVHINPSTFAAAFRRFERAIELHENSLGPFESFQTGLAAKWEHYKEWLYLEAQRLQEVGSWKRKRIGTGEILKRVIASVEIFHDQHHRNNIVDWQGRFGPKSKSHQRLLDALTDKSLRKPAEEALWKMYAEPSSDPAECFGQLVELFGARYDLISYLFFVRDWTLFMPLRSTSFPEVFALLGVPHVMQKRCNWENYSGALARFREVHRHLMGYAIPDGVRLIDAHSFCWMLGNLPAPGEQMARAVIVPLSAEAGAAPIHGRGGGGLTQDQLDERLAGQRRIGDRAQAIVLDAERHRLAKNNPRLAERVRDVSDDLTLGYDIQSFTHDGQLKPIEVKAVAKWGADLRFFLSENERLRSQALPNYTFALVAHMDSNEPTIFEFQGATLPPAALHPVNYEVRLKGPTGS